MNASRAPCAQTAPHDGPRPLRKDAELNRQRILQAATEIYAARGLNVTLDDIAAHAGVGVGTVYRRFPRKEVLIHALFEERLAEMVAMLEAGLTHPDPWEGFVTTLEQALTRMSADQGLTQLLLTNTARSDAADRIRDKLHPLSQRLVERAQASGELRDDVAGTDLPLIQLMQGALANVTREVDPDVWRRLLTIIIDGLRTKRGAPTPLPRPSLTPEQIEATLAKAGS